MLLGNGFTLMISILLFLILLILENICLQEFMMMFRFLELPIKNVNGTANE